MPATPQYQSIQDRVQHFRQYDRHANDRPQDRWRWPWIAAMILAICVVTADGAYKTYKTFA